MRNDTQKMTDIDTQAITWLVRLTSGDITRSEVAAFESWRKADRRHEAALAEARRLWVNMGSPLEKYYSPEALSDIAYHDNRRRFWRWQVMFPGVALLVFSMVMTQNWLTRWQYDYHTSTGEQRMLALDDGSKMWLDADSAADVRVNAGKRFVRLARGEAFFDIAHNPVLPFIVDAGAGEIKVLGTAFGVQRNDDGMVLTVERGNVQLSRVGHPDMTLRIDQQVQVNSEQDTAQVTTVNASQTLSWHQGQLVFEEQPLSDIITTLRRYDKRIIIFNSKKLGNIKLNAIIDINDLDDWYEGLQRALPVDINQVGPVIWLHERKTAR